MGGDDDAESVLHSHLSYGRGRDYDLPRSFHAVPNVPLLTNGQMVDSFFLTLALSLANHTGRRSLIEDDLNCLYHIFIGLFDWLF